MPRLLAPLVLLAPAGCGGDEPEADRPEPTAAATALDEELRDELLRMEAQDQGERTTGATLDDAERTQRLQEIVAEHGWPTYDLVGRQGRTPPG